jgi:hypothetical protein
MSPPRNVAFEVSDQFLRRDEGIGLFLLAEVTVIAFARFVVVAQYAYAIDHERQPVLEVMSRAWKWLLEAPQDQFGK